MWLITIQTACFSLSCLFRKATVGSWDPGGLTEGKGTWATQDTRALLAPGDFLARMGCRANRASRDIQESLWVNLLLNLSCQIKKLRNCLKDTVDESVPGVWEWSNGAAAGRVCGLRGDKDWSIGGVMCNVCCRVSLPQMNISWSSALTFYVVSICGFTSLTDRNWNRLRCRNTAAQLT